VIVLSGDHSIETGRQVLQHGVFYYLLKPFDLEELDQVVRIALAPGKRLAAGNDEGAPKTGSGAEKGSVT
jgi:DNA-binding NtrC family response regulator